MTFNIFKIRQAYLSGNINNPLLKDFMQYEHMWKDRYENNYSNDFDRCIDHCMNMINGKLKEVIFYKHFRKFNNLKFRDGNIEEYTTNRKVVGKADFYALNKNIDIELKAYDTYRTDGQILKELNDTMAYIYIYHKADLIYYWFTNEEIVKLCYRKDDNWNIIKLEESNGFNIVKQMCQEYHRLKVGKFKRR